jgi:hypothetical protein
MGYLLHLQAFLPILMLVELVSLTIVTPFLVMQSFMVKTLSGGVLRNNSLFLVLVIEHWLTQPLKFFGFLTFFRTSGFL